MGPLAETLRDEATSAAAFLVIQEGIRLLREEFIKLLVYFEECAIENA
jgi:hypothetical protein